MTDLQREGCGERQWEVGAACFDEDQALLPRRMLWRVDPRSAWGMKQGPKGI